MNSPYFMNVSNPNIPVIPLPNPGEGGPVGPGGAGVPVIPLPNPGEGGPVGPGGGGVPVIPLPNPGEGGPVGPDEGTPVVPLPNPGEGGPVAPGPGITIVTTFPRPDFPCFFCTTGRTGRVRFLNATAGYNPFQVYINNTQVISRLNEAEVSQYGRVTSGYQNITVSSMEGYVYIQKSVMINPDSTSTIAIINTASGLDLTVIPDLQCNTPFGTACFRACNLSHNVGPLDITSTNGAISFRNVQYKEVTAFNRINQGEYQFIVSKSGGLMNTPLVSSFATIRQNTIYTLYVFNWNPSPDAIRTIIVEDRK